MHTDELSAKNGDHAGGRPDEVKGANTKNSVPRATSSPDPAQQQRPDTDSELFDHLREDMGLSGPPQAGSTSSPALGTKERPSMVSYEGSTVSPSSVRTSIPYTTPAQLALSTMQFLPVPVLVLSSMKTVIAANEALGTLLGAIIYSNQEEPITVLDRLRGQSLSQLGIDIAEDEDTTPSDWDKLLDCLIADFNGASRGQDGNGNQNTQDKTVDGAGKELTVPVTKQPRQTVVNVHLTSKDSTRTSAKIIVTLFDVENQQTYFTLTFTDIATVSAPSPHMISKTTAGTTPERMAAATDNPGDASDVEQLISRIKEEDEERFKIMCDAMPQLVWTTTADGTIDFYNRRWYQYTGMTEEESAGPGWMKAIHPEDAGQSERLFKHCLKTGEPFVTEYRCRSSEGEWKWFIVRALPFRSKETGKIEKWFGTCTDADETIGFRHEVERTWQHLLTVISHAQVTVFQVDTQSRVMMLEGALVEEAIAGHDLPRSWYRGRDLYQVFGELNSKAPDERQRRFIRPIETILAGYPAEIVQEDEIEGRFYRTRFLPIGKKGEDGLVRGHDIEGAIGVMSDVTELKSKEADIEAQAREKQKLMASEAAAKEASKLKSQFLANMSHEIRTPITGVIGMAELLLDLELGEEQREFTENIYRSGNALLTVINDILDFSKVESGRLDIEEVQFSLSVIVRDVNKMLGFAAQRKNLDFLSDISPDIENDLVVLGDPGRVRQIITNLLTNSIKFTNQGYVKFTVRKEKETRDTIEIRFVIEDTGIGIEEEVRKRLFVPFSQGDASTARKFGGTGLGLTICKSLLDLMRGRITLESVVGSGTTATFWIPFNKPRSSDTNLVRIDSLSDRLQSEMSVSGNSSEPDGLLFSVPPELVGSGLLDGMTRNRSHRKVNSNVIQSIAEDLSPAERANTHVLVVEDNPINQKIATKTIKKLGFDVSAAWNGKEALDYLIAAQEGKQRKPDIILMDVQMPVIDGYKCTHLLRYHNPYKTYVQDVPIIAMTASAIQGDREKCCKAGMDDYLAKPVRGITLDRMLVRWTARKRAPEPEKFSSHGSEVSTECSQAGEHCDNADIPCVEHDDDDFLDLRRTPVEADHTLSPPTRDPSPSPFIPSLLAPPTKPPLNRSDTEETQPVRQQVARNDSVQTTKRSTRDNETDGEAAAHGRDVKLFDAAGTVGKEELPEKCVPSPDLNGGSRGDALTKENVENLEGKEEEGPVRLWRERA